MIVFARPPGWRRRAGDPGSAGCFAQARVVTSTLRSCSAAAGEDGVEGAPHGLGLGDPQPVLGGRVEVQHHAVSVRQDHSHRQLPEQLVPGDRQRVDPGGAGQRAV